MIRKILDKDVGLGIPRFVKKKGIRRRATTPEEILQDQAEAYLALCGLEKPHMPEYMLAKSFGRRIMSGAELGAARDASQEVTGLPDLLIFDPNRHGELLAIELKTDIGRMSAEQRRWQRILGTICCRTFEYFQETLDKWRMRK